MPPYWGLGFQVSRYGYEDLEEMRQVLNRFQQYNIPLDTQVADIDHFDRRLDFTIDPSEKWAALPEYFDYLHEIGMKTVLILDPAIAVEIPDYWAYTTAREKEVFIEWPGENPDFEYTNSSIMLGYVTIDFLNFYN
jgi:alpha-glucosidase (family GH31 glycosyl hydrolase)